MFKICSKENETQEHIYTCDEIWEISGKKNENNPEYEKVMTGNRREKITISKIFKQNMDIVEKYKEQNSNIK